jgi:hypothetical protein
MPSTEYKAGIGAPIKGDDDSNKRPLPIVAKVGPDTSSGEVLVPAPYRDYSRVPPERTAFQRNSKEPAQTFPMKLHEILTNPEFEDIISWLPHGRAWRIVRHKAFEERVIPLYFRHGRYSSFARQVNGWGFRRITHGTDYNSYYHEMFLRGLPHLCEKMKRLASKDEARVKNEDAPTPDFYALSRDHPLPEGGSTTQADNQDALVVGLPSSVGPILGQRQGYATGLPSSGQGAATNPTAIHDLSKMSLEDLERQRAEIIRQMQMQLSTSAPAPVSAAPASYVGQQDFVTGMASQPAGAPAVAVSAHTAAPAPYPTSSAAAGTGWNAPPSSMPAHITGGDSSQAALYQALISQLTSGAGNQPAPAPPPPPPPPPPQQYGAASNQSILEALLGGGGSSGGLAQLLSGGGGTEANSSQLFQLQQQLQQTQQFQQQSTAAPHHGNESRPTPTGDFQNLYEQPTSQQQGNTNDAAATIQRQLQLALSGQQGGNELTISGQQGGSEGAHATSDFRNLYQQGSTASHQRGGEEDFLAAIQRQLQQGTAFQQQNLQQQHLPQLQQHLPQQQPQHLREQGRNENDTSLLMSYQMPPASQQHASDNDVMANLQRQIQMAASQQQNLQQQNDSTANMHQLQLLGSQLQAGQSNTSGAGGGNPSIAELAAMLSGQSNSGGGGGGGGNPNIAELAAMLGLPGFSRPNDSSS